MNDIKFTVIYTENNQPIKYEMTSFLDCNLLEEIYNMEKDSKDEPIQLNLFHDIFKKLYYNEDFVYDVDRIVDEKYDEEYYDNKQNELINHIIQGLSYFNCTRLYDVLIEIQQYFYIKEKNRVEQKFIESFCKDNTYIPDIFSSNSLISLKSLQDLYKYENFYVYRNTSIPISYFENNFNKNLIWPGICSNTSVPVEFIENHLKDFRGIEDVLWRVLSENPTIPPEFFLEHKDFVKLRSLELNLGVSPKLLENFVDIIDWDNVSGNFSLPVEFFEKYKDKPLNWGKISNNPNIPFDFFKDHVPEPPTDMFCSSPNIPFDFIEKYTRDYTPDDWSFLCKNPSIPFEFFEEHIDKVNFYSLSDNPSIPLEFFERHREVQLNNLYKRTDIPLSFIAKHKIVGSLFYEELLLNSSINIDYFIDHKNRDIRYFNIYRNNFSIYIERQVDKKLKTINNIINDKTVEINTIVLHCLNILSNKNIDKSMLFLSKLKLPKYLLLSNTVNYSKNVFPQIKHFLCSLKSFKYKDKINEICSILDSREILNPILGKTIIPEEKKEHVILNKKIYDLVLEQIPDLTIEEFNINYHKSRDDDLHHNPKRYLKDKHEEEEKKYKYKEDTDNEEEEEDDEDDEEEEDEEDTDEEDTDEEDKYKNTDEDAYEEDDYEEDEEDYNIRMSESIIDAILTDRMD